MAVAGSTFTIYPSYTVTAMDADDEAPLDDNEINLPSAKNVPGKISYNRDGTAVLRLSAGFHVGIDWRLRDEHSGETFTVTSTRPNRLSGGGLIVELSAKPWMEK